MRYAEYTTRYRSRSRWDEANGWTVPGPTQKWSPIYGIVSCLRRRKLKKVKDGHSRR